MRLTHNYYVYGNISSLVLLPLRTHLLLRKFPQLPAKFLALRWEIGPDFFSVISFLR